MNEQGLKHYTLLEQIGEGGMGKVYKAQNDLTGHIVAVKVLHDLAHRYSNNYFKRFDQEAKLTQRLHHPNICEVLKIDVTTRGLPFMVMTYYEGVNLSDRLQQGSLDIREALGIVLHIARGLNYAHKQGIVHRDVKPSNILLDTSTREAVLLDSGLAKYPDSENLTHSGALVGTIDYLSPERAKGQECDARGDLWSLGVVLYECLTESRPFTSDSNGSIASVVLAIISEEPEPIGQRSLADAGQDLNNAQMMINRLLAKDIEVRYQSADDVIADIETVLEGIPLQYPSPIPQHRRLPQPSPPPVTSIAIDNNISIDNTTVFVGRVEEQTLANLYLRNKDCRVITLLGLGGVGKTRLGMQIGLNQLQQSFFKDGVFFTSLDGISESLAATANIAKDIGISLRGPTTPLQQLARQLHDKQLLLILDNIERLETGRDIVEYLLERCVDLKVVITSRSRLYLEQEWILPLEGLAFPKAPLDTITEEDLPRLKSQAAVQLFVHEARRITGDFVLNQHNANHVLNICQLSYGSPLALELAASWLRSLTLEQIIAQVSQSLDFLQAPHRKDRQRSIRAVFDYTWSLLRPTMQEKLQFLAIFPVSFSANMAAHVAAISLSELYELSDQSVLKQHSSQARYELQPLLRQYAAEKLREGSGNFEKAQAKIHSYFLERSLWMHQQDSIQQVDFMTLELENIKHCLDIDSYLAEHTLADAIIDPLKRFFSQTGRLNEGSEFIHKLYARYEFPYTKALAELALAWLYVYLGQNETAASYAQKALHRAEALASRVLRGKAIHLLAITQSNDGHHEVAVSLFKKAAQDLHNNKEWQELNRVLNNLAISQRWMGQLSEAEQSYQHCIQLSKRFKDRPQLMANLNNMASLLLYAGKTQEALPYLKQADEVSNELHLDSLTCFIQANLGFAYQQIGQLERSLPYFLRAVRQARKLGIPTVETGVLSDLGRSLLLLSHQQLAYRLALLAASLSLKSQILSSLAKAIALLCEVQVYRFHEQGDTSHIDFLANVLPSLYGQHDLNQHYQNIVRGLSEGLELEPSPPQNTDLDWSSREKKLKSYESIYYILSTKRDRDGLANFDIEEELGQIL